MRYSRSLVLGLLLVLLIAGCEQEQSVYRGELHERDGVFYAPFEKDPFSGKHIESRGDGSLSKEGFYIDGRQEGLFTSWYENGQLKSELTHKSGKLEGLAREWYENGQLKSEATYKNGKVQGLSRDWHENGQLWGEGNWKSGNPEGLWRIWDLNGRLKSEATYKNGQEDGLSRRWGLFGSNEYNDTCYSNGVKVDMSNCE